MIDVDKVIELQDEKVKDWHESPISNEYEGIWELICTQHSFNFELWHQEDIARSKEVSDGEIATVKRAIDRLNQARNDHIEKIDDWLTEEVTRLGIQLQTDARLRTETPGSVIDRLSIMALRLYHYREQLDREDVDREHRERVQQRTLLCMEQRRDLARSLTELLADIEQGACRHKTYRQMKMYNDPSLNPYLYRQKSNVGS
jgi:hypothetical protein